MLRASLVVRCLPLAFLVSMSAVVQAADVPAGQAKGSLVIDGKPLALHYASATARSAIGQVEREALMSLLTRVHEQGVAMNGTRRIRSSGFVWIRLGSALIGIEPTTS